MKFNSAEKIQSTEEIPEDEEFQEIMDWVDEKLTDVPFNRDELRRMYQSAINNGKEPSEAKEIMFKMIAKKRQDRNKETPIRSNRDEAQLKGLYIKERKMSTERAKTDLDRTRDIVNNIKSINMAEKEELILQLEGKILDLESIDTEIYTTSNDNLNEEIEKVRRGYEGLISTVKDMIPSDFSRSK